jgi:diguanylate cyclase (GGDEF)-like protein
MQLLVAESESAFLASKDFGDPLFLSEIRAAITRQPALVLLTIHERSGQTQYAFAKDRSLLPPSLDEPPLFDELPFGVVALSLPFAPASANTLTATGNALTATALFTVLSREDMFPLFKEAFVIIFCFFVATCIVLLLVPAQTRSSRGPVRSGRDRRDAEFSEEVPKTPRAAAGDAGTRRRGAADLFSPVTGLGWREHLEQRLKFELERAASFDQDLVVLSLAIDDYRRQSSRDNVYGSVASVVKRTFPFQDLSFEFGAGRYAVILPDEDIEKGIESAERFQRELAGSPSKCTVSVGLSSRNGRLIRGATILGEAERALDKAASQGRSRIVAFRADPEKYRDLMGEAQQ